MIFFLRFSRRRLKWSTQSMYCRKQLSSASVVFPTNICPIGNGLIAFHRAWHGCASIWNWKCAIVQFIRHRLSVNPNFTCISNENIDFLFSLPSDKHLYCDYRGLLCVRNGNENSEIFLFILNWHEKTKWVVRSKYIIASEGNAVQSFVTLSTVVHWNGTERQWVRLNMIMSYARR